MGERSWAAAWLGSVDALALLSQRLSQLLLLLLLQS